MAATISEHRPLRNNALAATSSFGFALHIRRAKFVADHHAERCKIWPDRALAAAAPLWLLALLRPAELTIHNSQFTNKIPKSNNRTSVTFRISKSGPQSFGGVARGEILARNARPKKRSLSRQWRDRRKILSPCALRPRGELSAAPAISCDGNLIGFLTPGFVEVICRATGADDRFHFASEGALKRGTFATIHSFARSFVESLEQRTLLTTYSINIAANPSSETVTIDYTQDHQTADVAFTITTTFKASNNDKDDHVQG